MAVQADDPRPLYADSEVDVRSAAPNLCVQGENVQLEFDHKVEWYNVGAIGGGYRPLLFDSSTENTMVSIWTTRRDVLNARA